MTKKIDLAVDGEVFSWNQKRGIPRRCREIFRGLPLIDRSLRVRICMQQPIRVADAGAWGVDLVNVPRLPGGLRPWFFWSRVRPVIDPFLARRFWRGMDADVYYSTHYGMPRIKGRMICTVHDMIPELFPESFSDAARNELVRSKRCMARQAARIICVSKHTMRDVVAMLGVSEEKCRVIYNAGYPEERVADVGWAREGDERFILYVGGYRAEYKNFRFMLRGLAEAGVLGGKRYRLVVAGPEVPTEDERERYRADYGDGVVEFRSDCSDDDLIDLYGRCALFIMPSLYEGFGIPVLEALSCGAPTACSNAASLPEVGGDVVRYFDPRSADELGAAVEKALAEGRTREAVAARKRWAARFSWERTAREFAEVVREVSAG